MSAPVNDVQKILCLGGVLAGALAVFAALGGLLAGDGWPALALLFVSGYLIAVSSAWGRS